VLALGTGWASEILSAFNAWRRSESDFIEPPHRAEVIGKAIDVIVDTLQRCNNSVVEASLIFPNVGDYIAQIEKENARLRDSEDMAESIICNALPPPHCTPEEWETIIRGWRDRKHGLSPNIKLTDAPAAGRSV
jgi:hypothetical protein